MPDLLIKESELLTLDKIIGPIPTQFGLPLVNFFNTVQQKRAQEAIANTPKESTPAKAEKKVPAKAN